MVFSNPTFLFLFLPLTLLGYLAFRGRAGKNLWLLGASVLFYFWGAGGSILVILYVSIVSFFGAVIGWQSAKKGRREKPPRWAIALLIAMLIGPLVLFKYVPPLFGYASALGWTDSFGVGPITWALPLGISFFTFHAISYVVDVSRGNLPAERSLRDYLLYLFVFPHQIAGPIVRYSEIVDEIKENRVTTAQMAAYGITRFTWGLGKKVLVADQCGALANTIFTGAAEGVSLTAGDAWLGAAAYALQIYFDFSGYSDMAIGLALLFGFHFPENFRVPYRSISVTDFWRRWHITLSRWFRDYVYIPFGGNRHGLPREYAGLILTFLLTSLWHGATLNFLLWGGLHSGMMVLERVTGLRKWNGWAIPRRILMLFFIVLSWVPFRAEGTHTTFVMWQTMFTGPLALSAVSLTDLTLFTVIALALGTLAAIGPAKATGFETVFISASARAATGVRKLHVRARWSAVAVPVLFLATATMVLWSDFSPFLYFQF
jgi:alginate O-acetyltransferase complex protein AlgI